MALPTSLRPTTRLLAVAGTRSFLGGGLGRGPSYLGYCRHQRFFSSEVAVAPDYLSEAELVIFNKIKDNLKPSQLSVQDVSGGCGSMYALDIVSEQFRGLPVIKQHRLVNKVLEEEMKRWHGVQLKTKAP